MCTALRALVWSLGSTAAPDAEVASEAAVRVAGELSDCLGGGSGMLARKRIVGRAGWQTASRPGRAVAVWVIDMAVQWAVVIAHRSG